MNTLKFKTNIQCNGCLSKVRPFLDAEQEINNWQVNLQSEDRVLTVETDKLDSSAIEDTIAKAGFKAEQVVV